MAKKRKKSLNQQMWEEADRLCSQLDSAIISGQEQEKNILYGLLGSLQAKMTYENVRMGMLSSPEARRGFWLGVVAAQTWIMGGSSLADLNSYAHTLLFQFAMNGWSDKPGDVPTLIVMSKDRSEPNLN